MAGKADKKKVCPVCGVDLKLAQAGYAMGSPLASDRFHADIYVCPDCGRVSLFKAETDDDMVKCPVCGTMHHKGERCVNCALNDAVRLATKA